MTPYVRTCLWFNEDAEAAVAFYTGLLPGSGIDRILRPDPDGPPLVIDFTLAGTPCQVLNGGPHFRLTEAVSISVLTADQAETDRLWAALTADGGVESRCGWLKDRFGLSWQIVPEAVPRLLTAPDRAAADRVFQTLMGMQRIEIAALEAAAAGA